MNESNIKNISEQGSEIRKAALALIENANCEFGESAVVSTTDLERLKAALMGEKEAGIVEQIRALKEKNTHTPYSGEWADTREGA